MCVSLLQIKEEEEEEITIITEYRSSEFIEAQPASKDQYLICKFEYIVSARLRYVMKIVFDISMKCGKVFANFIKIIFSIIF